MDYLQERKTGFQTDDSILVKITLGVNLLLMIVFFSLNFLSSPTLKYVYLISIIFAVLATFFLNYLNLLPVIFNLYFIEGQGRILWGNALWTKFIFDAIVLLSILKIFINNKKIYDFKKLPRIFLFLITLHFLWYGLEIFNLDTVSSLAAIASSKLYIYPILYFFALTLVDIDVNSKNFQRFLNYFIFLITLEVVLIFIQYYFKEKFLLEISPHYRIAMKDMIFTGSTFRPFGTSFVPGTISVFFYLTLGFLFFQKKSFRANLLNFILIPLSALAIVLCQVRSALLKFVIIYLLIQIGETIFQRFKPMKIFSLILSASILLWGSIYIANIDTSSNSSIVPTHADNEIPNTNEAIENVRDRFTSLGDTSVLQSSRISPSKFIEIASQKLVNKPFGYGPGFTGVLARLGVENNDFTIVKREERWAWDNLLMSLFIELGFGSIFYILIILYIPSYFFQFLIKFYKFKMDYEFKVLLTCFSSLTVIIAGNWGAVGITYNPESFIFWFFAALGFSTIAKYKNDIVPVTENALK